MLISSTIRNLEQALNYRTANHDSIANNISNADTPNYKAKSVEFRDTLNRSIKAYRTDQKHIPFSTEASVNPSFFTKTNADTSYSHNGNNVDIDKEMTKLAENQLYYQALIQRMNGKFSSMNTVIKGGR